MRWLILALLLTTPAQAEMVEIKWNAGDPIKSSEPWLVTDGGGYINGWSKNFMDGTVEERRKVAAEGVLKAEIIKPKATAGPVPFVILLHGCSGMNQLLWKWARSYADAIVAQGYGALILDSFTSRNVPGICTDPSQLNWARRRADDAYAALDYLIGNNLAVPDNELAARRETKGALPWKPAEHRTRAVSTALKAYALLASSANRGGVRILPGEE